MLMVFVTKQCCQTATNLTVSLRGLVRINSVMLFFDSLRCSVLSPVFSSPNSTIEEGQVLFFLFCLLPVFPSPQSLPFFLMFSASLLHSFFHRLFLHRFLSSGAYKRRALLN